MRDFTNGASGSDYASADQDDLLRDMAFITAHDLQLKREAEAVQSPIAEAATPAMGPEQGAMAPMGDMGAEDEQDPARMPPDKKQMIADYLMSRAQQRAANSTEYQLRTVKQNLGAK